LDVGTSKHFDLFLSYMSSIVSSILSADRLIRCAGRASAREPLAWRVLRLVAHECPDRAVVKTKNAPHVWGICIQFSIFVYISAWCIYFLRMWDFLLRVRLTPQWWPKVLLCTRCE